MSCFLVFFNWGKLNHGNYRLFSLSGIPGKIQEQIIKQSICNHLEEHRVLSSNQRDFVKYKLCQFNSIYERVMSLAGKEESETYSWISVSFCFLFLFNSIP